ncbi:FAD/FMN-containing isoamyl alcohol oxidase-like protein MreA [Cucurbitaria berberidis CBS 394.84]|uniref:FAD/FMN-containing isoamyl alcohol oxidase-like protein MreA n=1 Tax=Cucurbitaria berberidis CBS 394.84 TaxID=1168544 RepID=A0A9P4L6Q0_9PLEO|nr:FAD/FMN-containing isoamyl alcohol oxidase-like protein MreA [Cucurbitaria berberidis CBS 394.84]KAF1843577.1 FAD/FMN-containing isoamyl alcohol oxidase-like protein MreA [Cucurbitaria berberidis CBS 394.84]
MSSFTLWITAVLASITTGTPLLSAKVETGLLNLDVDLQHVDSSIKSLFLPGSPNSNAPGNTTSRCKIYPGDPEWPSDKAWSQLDVLTGKRLITGPTPLAAVCYPGKDYDAAKCAGYTTPVWQRSYVHMDDPIEMMSPVAQGLTCSIPSLYDSKGCTRGGFPKYVVNATEPKHVQLAVNFARNTGVRLVIKNTGHDFLGKSGGKDALSVWTHWMKSIDYIEKYVDEKLGYSGPAFKAGVGVQAFEIYRAAHEKGKVVVGGEGETVGIMGGYIQGGGHSPLTGLYGTGADNVLSFEAVTADGKFVVANSTSNTDLFWALRGGGGSTFAVAISVTVKAYPDLQVTASRFTISSAVTGKETFWAAIRAYVDSFIPNADAGTYTYATLIPTNGTFTFSFSPYFAPGKSKKEATALLDPFFTSLKDLGIKFDPNVTHFDHFYDAWRSSFPLEAVQKPNVATASRLFPRANFETKEKRQEYFDRIRASSENNRVQVHFNIQAKDPSNNDNAVNSHWRPLVSFSMQSVRWPINSTAAEILKIRKDFQAGDMQSWRDISPGAGSYLAEADRLEPDFGNAFWGDKYPRLLELKKKLDPQDLFYAATGVGSERWRVESVDGLPNENGKLCRVD